MRQIQSFYLTMIFFLCIIFFPAMIFANTLTPVGYWKQYSDVTGLPQSVIQIWNKQGILYGKVIKTFAMNGVPPKKNCTACSGDYHNQPIIGMTVLGGFTQLQPLVWGNGKILDPDSGKIYSCKLALSNEGTSLKVRGYIGISLLGRTQIWKRTK